MNPTNSPCIRKCCLNEHDICLGCFRSLDEILHWTKVDNTTRQQFLENAHQRKFDYQKQRGKQHL